MGGMLARALAQTSSETVWICNRSRSKADAIADEFDHVIACDTWADVVSHADVIVLCTKATDGQSLMRDDMGRRLAPNQLFVTTISSVNLDAWCDYTKATPIKMIPSLTQKVHKGIILLSYPRTLPTSVRNRLEARLSDIGKPCVIDEVQVRICSDITSCGPAFLATICKSWAESAARTGTIDRHLAQILLQEMFVGLSALIEAGMSFDEIVQDIKVPGGVTERGIESMEDIPLHMFSRLHHETARFSHHRHHSMIVDGIVSP